MGRRLILDTNLLIDYERGLVDVSAFDDDELALAALTVAEYRVGAEMARSKSQTRARLRALDQIIRLVEILDYTTATAEHHARLTAHTRRAGRSRGSHDLIIAAHAAQTGRILVSRDARARFGDLPGVTCEEV